MALGVRAGHGRALAWVGHPGTLAAVLVLAVNDHLLKHALPGLLTGKLSDVAGLLVAPPLLALLLEAVTRRSGDRIAAAALWATGLAFVLVKTTTVGADTASLLWSQLLPSRVLADPTDLVALPALLGAWRLWRRTRQHRDATRAVRTARALIAVPLAVLATAATGDPSMGPPSDTAVGTDRGSVVLVQSSGEGYGYGTDFSTTDGGFTWRLYPALGPGKVLPPDLSPEERRQQFARGPMLVVRTSDCVPGRPEHCYRVLRGQARVEETTDAGRHWSTAWELTAGRLIYLQRYEHAHPRPGGIEDTYQSTSLVVVPVPSGHTVIVTDQQEGIVVRDSGGHWSRLGTVEPPGTVATGPVQGFGANLGKEYLLAACAAWLAMLAGIGAVRVRWDTSRRTEDVVAQEWLRLGLGLLWMALLDTLDGGLGGQPGSFVLRLMVGTSFLVLCFLSIHRHQWVDDVRTGLALLGAALGTGALVILPFLGWTVTRPDSYRTATGLAALFLICGLAVSRRIGRRMSASRDPSFEPSP